MVASLFAQKLGMTHMYDDAHRHIPVTILKVADQAVTAIRPTESDHQTNVQIGAVTRKHVAKPQKSELSKQGIDLLITRRIEVAADSESLPEIGTQLTAALFSPGDKIFISGRSKGKGFAGGIKRYGWSRGPMTHGSKNKRKPGSIGSGYPQRVVPGKKLPGHMGATQVTSKGHRIVAVNEQDNTIAVSGAVPGAAKSFVIVTKEKSL